MLFSGLHYALAFGDRGLGLRYSSAFVIASGSAGWPLACIGASKMCHVPRGNQACFFVLPSCSSTLDTVVTSLHNKALVTM